MLPESLSLWDPPNHLFPLAVGNMWHGDANWSVTHIFHALPNKNSACYQNTARTWLEDKLLATHSCNCRRPARLFLMVSSHLQEISSTGNCGKLIESWLDVKAYAATAGPSTNCLQKGTSALFVAVLFLIFTNVGSVAIRLDSLYKQLQENRGCSCPHLPLDQLTSWLASCHVSPGISRLGWAQKPPQQRPLPCRRSKWAAEGHLPSTLQGKLGCAQPCTVHRMNSWP